MTNTSFTASQIILEYVCPTLGMVTGNAMFFAPYADARKAALNHYSLNDMNLNPTPWAFMLGNCFGWVTYSYLLHNYFVFFANAPGLVLSVWLNMVAVKLQFCEHRSREVRNSIVGALNNSNATTQEFLKSSMSTRQFLLSEAEGEKEGEGDLSFHNNNNSRKHSALTRRRTTDVDTTGEKQHDEETVGDNAMETSVVNTLPKHQQQQQQSEDHKAAPTTSEAEAATSTTQPSSLEHYAQLVWNVTSQATPAPAPHERLVMGMMLFWTGVVTTIALFGAKAFSSKTRQLIVGVAVNLNLVFFYAAPLSTIFKVLNTRCSAMIHVPTMLTNTANGAFWCAYGVAVQDWFIAVPNGLGSLLGVVQILLCVLFPRRPREIGGGSDTKGEALTDEEPAVVQVGAGAGADDENVSATVDATEKTTATTPSSAA